MLVNVQKSSRLDQNRIETAHSVQLRDAEPLINLEKIITKLAGSLGLESGVIVLSGDEDVPVALYGLMEMPEQLPDAVEAELFEGQSVEHDGVSFFPFFYNDYVVGYLALPIALEEAREELKSGLIEAYVNLTGKEFELADSTARLEYKNESVSRKQRQLEQAIRFKNNVLSLTTHDLRSPLTAVTGFLEMMQLAISASEDQNPLNEIADYHKKISQGVKNISDLVDQLYEIALLELQQIELNLIKVDLNWIVQEVCDVMQGPAISKKQTLEFERHETPLYVEIDIQKGKRILFNLIGNAIKYTSTHGHIDVRLYQERGLAHVAVKDTGIGIPEDKIQSIFEPFTKVSKHGTSGEMATGLGLFTCNYFTHLFKGSITVESEVDEGSTFYLHLPMASLGF